MTALAIASSSSHQRKCRVQLDTGAMLSLVSSKLACTLGAKRLKNTALLISGVGGDLHSPHQVEFTLNSLRRTDSTSVIASVVESIPEYHTGGRSVTHRDLQSFKDLDLVDPEYSINCKVDVLLGVDYCASCILGRNVHSDSRNMVAATPSLDGL